jgi:hypothetical protein
MRHATRALVVLSFTVVACAVACPPAASGARSCNQDRDCFVAEVCSDGFCVPDNSGFDAGFVDAGSVDAGSVDAGFVDAGPSDAGEADAGSDAGVVDAGSDAGVVDAGSDAGVVDAGPSECPIFIESFDSPVAPPFFASAQSGCVFAVKNGVFDADLPASTSACVVFGPTIDMRIGTLSIVFLDDLTVDETQQFVSAGNESTGDAFLLLAFNGGNFAARRATGPSNDDVDGVFPGPAPHVLELDFSQPSPNVQHVRWIADGVVAREGDFGDDLSAATPSFQVQAFAPPPSDPPPVDVDSFTFVAPCP